VVASLGESANFLTSSFDACRIKDKRISSTMNEATSTCNPLLIEELRFFKGASPKAFVIGPPFLTASRTFFHSERAAYDFNYYVYMAARRI